MWLLLRFSLWFVFCAKHCVVFMLLAQAAINEPARLKGNVFQTVQQMTVSSISLASCSVTPTICMSSFNTSINLLWGFPLFLLPGSSTAFVQYIPIYWTTCPTFMSKPPQACLSNFISKLLNLSFPSEGGIWCGRFSSRLNKAHTQYSTVGCCLKEENKNW